MRVLPAGILWLSSLICVAQTQPQISRPASQDGGVREVLESINIPPIPNGPFFATLETEWIKYAADGATFTLANQRHTARDAHGRVYKERWLLVPKDGKVESTMNWIQLEDPKQHTLYNCSVEKHICDLLLYDPADDLSPMPPHKATSMQLPNGEGAVTWEELGSRNIAGMDTVGTRETTIRNTGTMGNDQPLNFVSEYWHSDRLGINLLSIRSSPFFGKQTFTISEVTPGDPDPKLFELPAGFTVHDERKNPPISH